MQIFILGADEESDVAHFKCRINVGANLCCCNSVYNHITGDGKEGLDCSSYLNVAEIVPASAPPLRAGAASPTCTCTLVQERLFADSLRTGLFCRPHSAAAQIVCYSRAPDPPSDILS